MAVKGNLKFPLSSQKCDYNAEASRNYWASSLSPGMSPRSQLPIKRLPTRDGIEVNEMVRRVPVVKEVEGDVRKLVSGHLARLERKERLIHDGKLTERLSYLRALVADVEAWLQIELDRKDLPGNLGLNPRSKYTLNDQLIEQ